MYVWCSASAPFSYRFVLAKRETVYIIKKLVELSRSPSNAKIVKLLIRKISACMVCTMYSLEAYIALHIVMCISDFYNTKL
jgi:hypothetical protein